MSNDELTIGTKYGCFVIIEGPEAYYNEKIIPEIKRLEEEKKKFLIGEKNNTNFDTVEAFDECIERKKTYKKYKCQCKCGKIHYLDREHFFLRRRHDCGENCGLKKARQQKYKDACPRKKHNSYGLHLLNKNFGSLEVLECVDENLEGEPILFDKRKLGAGVCYIYKLYKCRCYLCGREYQFRSDAFVIHNDMYGSRARDGYYSDTFCECHMPSSFEWRTMLILSENKIDYRVEVSFPNLYGAKHKNLLRYDFAIYGENGEIKYLIECQGKQHYEPASKFGGKNSFELQKINDDIKRKYAEDNGIPLIEIPFACNTYESEMKFLKNCGVLI